MKWLKLFESFSKIKNIVIVGGGISSLYTAYLIKKNHPGVKFTIIEKDSEVGGRVKMAEVDGVSVPTGAHFIRLNKDKLVQKLLKELDIQIKPYELQMDYTFKSIDIKDMIRKLKSKSKDFDRSELTFKEFATVVLGKDDFEQFINITGYTDYLNYDFIDALENYGLEDNIPGYEAADIDWSKVCQKLVKFIGEKNIVYNTEVKSIKRLKDTFVVNSKYECDAIVIGVTINALKKLISNEVYSGIQSQTFLKVFAKVDNFKPEEKYNVVDSPLRKVVQVKGDVWTIAFSDNKDATLLKDKDGDYFTKQLRTSFKDSDITISKLKKFWWEEGTHYFRPLRSKFSSRGAFIKQAQNPEDGIWVVGEVVALRQGWVEGALQSVENIDFFKKL